MKQILNNLLRSYLGSLHIKTVKRGCVYEITCYKDMAKIADILNGYGFLKVGLLSPSVTCNVLTVESLV